MEPRECRGRPDRAVEQGRMKTRRFETEAALCSAFIAWAEGQGAKCYAEWQGWDILVVLHDGRQIGVQAKLRFSDHVIIQALPGEFGIGDNPGPDFRAVLMPDSSTSRADISHRLGLVVFDASDFERPRLMTALDRAVDWSPSARHPVPETSTDSVAGSPSPVTLTTWKRCALHVLAELEKRGSISAKRMREIGVNPSRWMSCRWLVPTEERGLWVRGEKCPRFDQQHPSAYERILNTVSSEASRA